jgi:hypothetical protein
LLLLPGMVELGLHQLVGAAGYPSYGSPSHPADPASAPDLNSISAPGIEAKQNAPSANEIARPNGHAKRMPGSARLQRALDEARLRREPPWATLGRVGEELAVPELVELADSLGIAGTECARVRRPWPPKPPPCASTS